MSFIGIISIYFKTTFATSNDINDSIYVIKCGEHSWVENIRREQTIIKSDTADLKNYQADVLEINMQ